MKCLWPGRRDGSSFVGPAVVVTVSTLGDSRDKTAKVSVLSSGRTAFEK